MSLSIRARMILAMNVLVAAVGIAVGQAGIGVAAAQIERKLVHESAANAAELIGRRNWPLDSDALMAQVGQILGAEVAIGPLDATGAQITAASLSAGQRADFLAQVAQAGQVAQLSAQPAGQPGAQVADGPVPARVVLGGKGYRLGTGVIRRASPSMEPERRRLYLLVPEDRLQAARSQVAGRIALFTLAAVVVVTAAGLWLSTSLARPVRRLADRMDRLALEGVLGERPGAAAPAAGPPPGGSPIPAADRKAGGPPELARLMRSFDGLLSRLEAARRELDRSARLAALGQLAAAVAHELRNPLSGIKMNARVLADELASAGTADRSLELIIREIDRMDLYLNELLDLASASAPAAAGAPSRPGQEAGRRTEVEAVRLDGLADSVVALLEGQCRHAGVEVRRSYDPAAPAARAHGQRIRQVLLNLMLNALEAMPHGGTMTLSAGRGQGGTVRLDVADTGQGVQAPQGADIFEPFVTSKPGGTGLGLYISRRVVEGFGGRIGCDSSPAGSTFWFELPAAD